MTTARSPLSPGVLRRSTRFVLVADTLSMVFFAAIQGAVFNFYLEDLGLLHRLGWFMGLSSLGGIGSLAGAWVQSRTGKRWSLFYWGSFHSRALWLVIGAMPFFCPDLKGTEVGRFLFVPLSAALFLYFFIGAMAGNAWLSWMADLLPTDKQGGWWGIRQVGVMGGAAVSRMGFGWYLEAHRGWDGYLTIYVLATLVGFFACNVLYLFVVHPVPKRSSFSLPQGLRMCFQDQAFRSFLAVFMVWYAGIALVGPAFYRFMREGVGMGVTQISFGETLGLLIHTAFGFMWGAFADRHGRRGALVFCLVLNALGLLFLFAAGPDRTVWVYLTFAVNSIGGSGALILMWPMLFAATETLRENRATAMAVFTLVLSLGNALAFNLVEPVFYPLSDWLLGGDPTRTLVGVIMLGMLVRLLAAALALRLPAPAHEVPPGIVLQMFTQTNPLRAAVHLMRYVTVGGRQGEVGPLSGDSHILEEDAARALKQAVALKAYARQSLSAASPPHGRRKDRRPEAEE